LNVDMLDVMYPSSSFVRFAPIFLDDLSPSDLKLFYLAKVYVMGRSTVFLRGISPHTEADLKERDTRFRANVLYWEGVIKSKALSKGEVVSSVSYSEGSFCIRMYNAVTCISTLTMYQVDWAIADLVDKLRVAREACIVPVAAIVTVAQVVDDQVPHQLMSYPSSQDNGYLEYSTTFAMGFPRPIQLIGENRRNELACALLKCDVCEDVSGVLMRYFDIALRANASTTIRHPKRETRSKPQILKLMANMDYSKQCSFGLGHIMCVQKTREYGWTEGTGMFSKRGGMYFLVPEVDDLTVRVTLGLPSAMFKGDSVHDAFVDVVQRVCHGTARYTLFYLHRTTLTAHMTTLLWFTVMKGSVWYASRPFTLMNAVDIEPSLDVVGVTDIARAAGGYIQISGSSVYSMEILLYSRVADHWTVSDHMLRQENEWARLKCLHSWRSLTTEQWKEMVLIFSRTKEDVFRLFAFAPPGKSEYF